MPKSKVPVPQPRGESLASVIPYAASSTSGLLFQHIQQGHIMYTVLDWWPQGRIGGLVSCGEGTWPHHHNVCPQLSSMITKKVLMNVYFTVDDTITVYNPSSFSGCVSGVSGTVSGNLPFVPSICAGVSAFNSYACMSAVCSSVDSSTGIGTSGIITFEPGVYTRPATPLDMEDHAARSYNNIVIDSPFGVGNEWVDDPNALRTFIDWMNGKFYEGALKYIDGNIYLPEPAWLSSGRCTLWDTSLIC